ncbi:MAG: transglutaminase domain-containing protein [Planctomycetaceae bacterium]|nr:transglutaminase domain-containing protein [Planctomycetaceae bacterium]
MWHGWQSRRVLQIALIVTGGVALACVIFWPSRSVRKHRDPPPQIEFSLLQQIYPPDDDIVLAELSADPAAGEAVLSFDARVPFTVSSEGSLLPVEAGRLRVPFDFHAKEAQRTLAVVAAGRQYPLLLRYFSADFYRSLQAKRPGVLIATTSMPRGRVAARAVRIGPRAGELRADLNIARLEEEETARFLQVFNALEAALAATMHHRGRLVYSPDGLALLKEVRSGVGYADCSGLSAIARDVFSELGLAARIVELKPPVHIVQGLHIQASDGHTAGEVRLRGRWCWFDLTLHCAYVRQAPGGAKLSLFDLLRQLHDADRRDQLRFGVFTKDNGIEEIGLGQNPVLAHSLGVYYTTDKVLAYPSPKD